MKPILDYASIDTSIPLRGEETFTLLPVENCEGIYGIMSPAHSKRCPLCEANVSIIADGFPGYKEGHKYKILECEYCDLQFAAPNIIPSGLYDSIYDNADKLPGYDRYCHYLKLVQSAGKPLDELASQEAAYWFIRFELSKLSPAVRILEIGSGLGYLAYAIHAAGYSITAIDISKDAISKARSTFGDLYLHKDLTELAEEQPCSFDVVIMTEVLEHVADPKGFLGAAASMLKKNGQIMLTTPNKSDFPLCACWDTENPPVHLWWFSETAIRRLAQIGNLSIRIADFASMYVGSQRKSPSTSRPAFLDEAGGATEAAKRWLATASKTYSKLASPEHHIGRLGPISKFRTLIGVARRVRHGYYTIFQRSSQMGVVLTKR
jgi:SAM-dependent methyltransferase